MSKQKNINIGDRLWLLSSTDDWDYAEECIVYTKIEEDNLFVVTRIGETINFYHEDGVFTYTKNYTVSVTKPEPREKLYIRGLDY